MLKRFDELREEALTYLKDFLSNNQKVLIVPESKIGEVVQIAYNIIINKNKLYADVTAPEWQIRVNDLSFDEIYHILNFLKEVNNE